MLHLMATAELSPVCAVMGGIIGQEVFKSISGKDETIENYFFFSGLGMEGKMNKVY
jgi:ubiquitin-like 1-activating enzyme E1 A